MSDRVITIEAVYDNSDIMTDYFDRNARLKEWYVADFDGKMVTEPMLRKMLQKLPDWLRNQTWTYQKGEKYSMSDHPYGQLECRPTLAGNIVNSIGNNEAVRFIVTLGYLETFQMNHSKEEKIPSEKADFEKFIDLLNRERASRRERASAKPIPTPQQPPELDLKSLKAEFQEIYGAEEYDHVMIDLQLMKIRNNRMADIQELVGETTVQEWEDEVDRAYAETQKQPSKLEQALTSKNQRTLLSYVA